jgi:subtilisin family serine protease
MLIFVSLLVALGSAFQATSTHCSTADVQLGDFTDRQLIGCGAQYGENVLWNLDRADGVSDGTARRLTRGAGAVVYVIDTGVEQSHDEFQREGGTNVIGGLDPFAEAGETPCSASDTPTHPCSVGASALTILITHGTAVASIVAGRTTGVAPGASIVAVRVYGSGNHVPVQLVFARALDDIVKHAFDPSTPPFRTAIVNMSASPGASASSDPLYQEFDRKMRLMINGVDKDFHADPDGKRFLFVVFGGNSNLPGFLPGYHGQCTGTYDVSTYPALAGPEVDGLITVGGMDRDNHIWDGSCRGSAIEILAPADHILCASVTGHDHYRGTYGTPPFDYSSGTSYATPFVSGIAARMLEANPNLTPVELEAMIKASPSFIDPANGTAAGGHVAVLIENGPPPPGPKRRAVAH